MPQSSWTRTRRSTGTAFTDATATASSRTATISSANSHSSRSRVSLSSRCASGSRACLEQVCSGARLTKAGAQVGCGVGNTSLPVAAGNVSATVHSCDYSATAIDILRSAPDFDAARMHAFVADMTKNDLTHHVPMASLDAVTCVFALSANAASALPHVRPPLPPMRAVCWSRSRSLCRVSGARAASVLCCAPSVGIGHNSSSLW